MILIHTEVLVYDLTGVMDRAAEAISILVSEIVSLKIINAKAARAFLRFGLFIVMDPPKWILVIVRGFWRRCLRCNRHGIGLRLRGS